MIDQDTDRTPELIFFSFSQCSDEVNHSSCRTQLELVISNPVSLCTCDTLLGTSIFGFMMSC